MKQTIEQVIIEDIKDQLRKDGLKQCLGSLNCLSDSPYKTQMKKYLLVATRELENEE